MALIVPGGPGWAYCTTAYGALSASSNGVTVTPGTSDSNGSTTALISAITHDVEYLVLGFAGFQTAAAVNRTQVDILIDPAGGTSWGSTPLIADLIVGGCPVLGVSAAYPMTFHFPIWIRAGSSIGARARTSHTVAPSTPRVSAVAYGGSRNPASWWCGQTVTAIGTTAASSSGTSHTAGTSPAYSTWANLGSTTPAVAGAVQWSAQSQISAMVTRGYSFEFGVGGTMIGASLTVVTSTNETAMFQSVSGVQFCSIPAGAQLQVRGICAGGTVDALDVAAYVVS